MFQLLHLPDSACSWVEMIYLWGVFPSFWNIKVKSKYLKIYKLCIHPYFFYLMTPKEESVEKFYFLESELFSILDWTSRSKELFALFFEFLQNLPDVYNLLGTHIKLWQQFFMIEKGKKCYWEILEKVLFWV